MTISVHVDQAGKIRNHLCNGSFHVMDTLHEFHSDLVSINAREALATPPILT